MKESSESNTVFFVLVFVFCILCTITMYFTLRPDDSHSESSELIIFGHPENAS